MRNNYLPPYIRLSGSRIAQRRISCASRSDGAARGSAPIICRGTSACARAYCSGRDLNCHASGVASGRYAARHGNGAPVVQGRASPYGSGTRGYGGLCHYPRRQAGGVAGDGCGGIHCGSSAIIVCGGASAGRGSASRRARAAPIVQGGTACGSSGSAAERTPVVCGGASACGDSRVTQRRICCAACSDGAPVVPHQLFAAGTSSSAGASRPPLQPAWQRRRHRRSRLRHPRPEWRTSYSMQCIRRQRRWQFHPWQPQSVPLPALLDRRHRR